MFRADKTHSHTGLSTPPAPIASIGLVTTTYCSIALPLHQVQGLEATSTDPRLSRGIIRENRADMTPNSDK